jgi:hypothetical protein
MVIKLVTLIHCLQTNEMHFTSTIYYLFINPYMCFGLI